MNDKPKLIFRRLRNLIQAAATAVPSQPATLATPPAAAAAPAYYTLHATRRTPRAPLVSECSPPPPLLLPPYRFIAILISISGSPHHEGRARNPKTLRSLSRFCDHFFLLLSVSCGVEIASAFPNFDVFNGYMCLIRLLLSSG